MPLRRSSLRSRIQTCLALLAGASGLTVGAAASAATSIPLGDLKVAPSKVANFYPFDETVYHQARSWPEYDVSCTSSPCASGKQPMPASWGCSVPDPAANGFADAGALDCAVDNAPPQSVVYVPKGVYEMGPHGAPANAITISRSDVVLRCEDPNTTRFRMFDKRLAHQCKDQDGRWNANMCGAMAVSVAAPDMFRNQVVWTSGYLSGNTQIGVSSTAGFAVGDWVLLSMDDGSETCELIDSIPTQAAVDPLQRKNVFNHYARIVSMSGSSLTLDRPLRMDYNVSTCGAKAVTLIAPIENVGIEGCGFETATSTPRSDFGKAAAVTLAAAANSWVVGNHFERFDQDVVRFRMSMRNWFQGNRVDDVQGTQFNTEGIHVSSGAADNVIENNAFIQMTVVSKQEAGAEGNISAYNYTRANGAQPREKSFFNHGRFVRESLWEGNDVDSEMMVADHWWGRNGARIMAYRNRVVGPTSKFAAITTNRDKAGAWPIASDLLWIGNTAPLFMRTAARVNGFPGCLNHAHDFDAQIDGMTVEKNMYRDPLGFQIDSPEPTTDCGSGVGACPSSNPGPTPSLGTNVEGDRAPAAWANDVIPHSLYRPATPPTWWCQEACSWSDVHAGIGAWGDDFSAGSLCKLPAQILFEGGTCTPVPGSGYTGPPSGGVPGSGGGGGGTGGGSGTGGGGSTGGTTTPPPQPTGPAAPYLLP